MKKVRINVGKVGVVKRNGDFNRMLSAGSYWIGWREQIFTYEMSAVYKANIDLNIMLMDENVRNNMEVIEVKDDQIALKYVASNLEGVLTPGRYFIWKGYMNFNFKLVDLSSIHIPEDVSVTTLNQPMLKSHVRNFDVSANEKGLLFVNGVFQKVLTQGVYYFWKNAEIIEVKKVDLRLIPLEISGQEILTKDKAALRINFFVQFQITDIEKAIVDSKDYEKQLYVNVQLALREFVGGFTLDEILDKKEQVSKFVMESVKESNKKIGVEISAAGIKDVILPGEIKEIMNQVLVATKKAQANTISRREETAATRSLLNTAKLMEDNEMLFKLKEMEYVEQIAEKVGEISLSGGDQMMGQLTKLFSK